MMLNENVRVRKKIPAAMVALMEPLTKGVDKLLQPGVVSLCWSSTQIHSYIKSVYSALGDLEVLVNRVNDILEFRVEALLRDMIRTPLCEIPDDGPVDIPTFLARTEVIS